MANPIDELQKLTTEQLETKLAEMTNRYNLGMNYGYSNSMMGSIMQFITQLRDILTEKSMKKRTAVMLKSAVSTVPPNVEDKIITSTDEADDDLTTTEIKFKSEFIPVRSNRPS